MKGRSETTPTSNVVWVDVIHYSAYLISAFAATRVNDAQYLHIDRDSLQYAIMDTLKDKSLKYVREICKAGPLTSKDIGSALPLARPLRNSLC